MLTSTVFKSNAIAYQSQNDMPSNSLCFFVYVIKFQRNRNIGYSSSKPVA